MPTQENSTPTFSLGKNSTPKIKVVNVEFSEDGLSSFFFLIKYLLFVHPQQGVDTNVQACIYSYFQLKMLQENLLNLFC